MTEREALKLALEALTTRWLAGDLACVDKAITVINEFLAQPERSDDRERNDREQEPVACHHKRYSIDVNEQIGHCLDCGAEGRMRFIVENTTPQRVSSEAPQRKPLTNERIEEIWDNSIIHDDGSYAEFARAIEAAHGIKE